VRVSRAPPSAHATPSHFLDLMKPLFPHEHNQYLPKFNLVRHHWTEGASPLLFLPTDKIPMKIWERRPVALVLFLLSG